MYSKTLNSKANKIRKGGEFLITTTTNKRYEIQQIMHASHRAHMKKNNMFHRKMLLFPHILVWGIIELSNIWVNENIEIIFKKKEEEFRNFSTRPF